MSESDTTPTDDGAPTIDQDELGPDVAGAEPETVPMSALEDPDGDGVIVERDGLYVDSSRLGALGEYRARKKRRRKRKRLARQGYVTWYLVDGQMPAPRFVRPSADGGGFPDIVHDGDRYIFPENAAVMSSETGMRTYIHKRGEMDPINLRDPASHATSPDQAQEYLTSALQTSSPSGLLGNIDTEDLVIYGMMAVIALVVGYAYISGGGL